jgi:hypothetical protein
MRLQYEHAERTGKGLDEEVFSDIGEQVSLRQFDISNRRRDRLTALVEVVPISSLGVNASVGVGQEHRPGAVFGLQDNDLRTFSVGIDANRKDALLLGTQYSFERYSSLQHSRQASPGPQFDDPTRDWSTDMNEDVHTMTTSLDLPHVASRTSARLAYDYVHAGARYVYLLPANSTLVQPQQLPAVRNVIRRASADLRYSLSQKLGVGLGYWYDSYDAQDFARSPGTLDSPFLPALIDLMYLNRPYRAHTASVRLLYAW